MDFAGALGPGQLTPEIALRAQRALCGAMGTQKTLRVTPKTRRGHWDRGEEVWCGTYGRVVPVFLLGVARAGVP